MYSPKSYGFFDNLLLNHVGLRQIVIVAVHLVIFLLDRGDHPEFLLFCQSTLSWLKVVGGWWWWPVRLYCHLLGLGVLSILFPFSHSFILRTMKLIQDSVLKIHWFYQFIIVGLLMSLEVVSSRSES